MRKAPQSATMRVSRQEQECKNRKVSSPIAERTKDKSQMNRLINLMQKHSGNAEARVVDNVLERAHIAAIRREGGHIRTLSKKQLQCHWHTVEYVFQRRLTGTPCLVVFVASHEDVGDISYATPA